MKNRPREPEAEEWGRLVHLNEESLGPRESTSIHEGDPGVLGTRKATPTFWGSASTSVKWVDSMTSSSCNTLYMPAHSVSFLIF